MIVEDIGEPDGVNKYIREMKREYITFTDEKTGETERVGDYTNTERNFLVERKEAFDFMHSVMDGRYYKQLYKMKKYFDGPKYIIFEGSWDALMKIAGKKRSGIVADLIAARVRAATVGISWHETKDKEETAKLIKQIDAWTKPFEIQIKEKVNIGERITYYDKKEKKQKHKIIRVTDKRIIVLGVIVGTEKSKELLKRYKSISGIIEALIKKPKDVLSIKGIGPKTIENLKLVFTSDKKVELNARTNNKPGRVSKSTPKDKAGNRSESSRFRARQKQSFARDKHSYGKWKDYYDNESSR